MLVNGAGYEMSRKVAFVSMRGPVHRALAKLRPPNQPVSGGSRRGWCAAAGQGARAGSDVRATQQDCNHNNGHC